MAGLGLVMTQAEAAAVMCCSVRTVARLRREGKLRWIPGRPVRIREADLAACLEALAQPAPVPPRVAAAANALARVQAIAAQIGKGRN